MSKYTIDLTTSSGGGYCTIYGIKDYPKLGFKEFISKKRAIYARKTQLKLSKVGLSPKIYSNICRIKYYKLFPHKQSGWGYITELASPADFKSVSPRQLQNLVNKILVKTNLKFWDCHMSNIGFVRRNGKKKLVCIDTGKESFDGYANAWGNPDPGPKCSYCNKYNCRCVD